jgi:hypothetical protein
MSADGRPSGLASEAGLEVLADCVNNGEVVVVPRVSNEVHPSQEAAVTAGTLTSRFKALLAAQGRH